MRIPMICCLRFRAGCWAALLCVLAIFATSCAVTTPIGSGGPADPNSAMEAPVTFPPYNGEKISLAVLPLGLSERAAKRYPHLLESSVGMGVHNMLTDTLYRTKRFRFVETNEAVVKEAFRQQWLGASGALDENSAVRMGRVLGAKKAIYGEVYDYSEGKIEHIRGLSVETTPQVRVGIQVRLLDLETLEYIPASGLGTGTDWSRAC